MPARAGSPERYAFTKNCTLKPSRGFGKFPFGASWYVTQPSVVEACLSPPAVTRGVERTNTSASRMTYPRVSFTRTRTVIGAVRLVTRLGENWTTDTMRRWLDGTLVAGIEISPLGSLIAPLGSGSVTIADSPDMAVAEPAEFRAVMLNRILCPTSADV